MVAAKFANNPNVIGFDPINEPFPADFMTDPSILQPGVFDKEKLAPLYAKVFKKYMKHNKNQIMYFETGQFPDSYLGKVENAGFEAPPGGKNGSSNHVLNDHSYCCQLGPSICATGEPAADKGPECSQWHHDRIATRAADAKDLGIPLIVSEFGACFDSEECAREITQVADECDKVLAGWAYWEFKTYKDLTTTAGTGSEGFYNSDGSLQSRKVKAMSRTYLQRTQGTLQSMFFNTTSGELEARFTLNTSVASPTELYVNQELWYTERGFDVVLIDETFEESISTKPTKQEHNLYSFILSNSARNGNTILVRVRETKVDSYFWAMLTLLILFVIALLLFYLRSKRTKGPVASGMSAGGSNSQSFVDGESSTRTIEKKFI